MSNTFNFNNMINLSGGSNNHLSCVFSVYGGNVYCRIWDRNSATGTPFFFLPINDSTITLITHYLEECMSAEIGHKVVLEVSQWDRENNKLTNKKTITIGKGNAGVIYIGFIGEALVEEEKFQFKLPGSINILPNTPTDEQGSLIATKTFLSSLRGLSDTAVYLSRDKDIMEKKRNNNRYKEIEPNNSTTTKVEEEKPKSDDTIKSSDEINMDDIEF
jgi:hypothetical protein